MSVRWERLELITAQISAMKSNKQAAEATGNIGLFSVLTEKIDQAEQVREQLLREIALGSALSKSSVVRDERTATSASGVT